MNLILVVPDGILNNKKTIPTISNTYKAALDLAINESYNFPSKIVLLPANSFGTSKNEQEYAEEYLIKKNFNKDFILKGISKSKKYINTRQNFMLLIQHGLINCGNGEVINITKRIEEGLYTLVSSHLHIDRVILITDHFNWETPQKILVSYSKESPNITTRLVYYRFPELRMLYEMLIIFALRIEFKIRFVLKQIKNFI